ncbi:MAG: beta-lactamase family protein [Endomicrobia bacterium]|nr:beta-lactamase family protein [Endomicrobiia bacterium]MCL2506749.1 beta-lactamase family protein [Endomicrobiia bacterium]
MQTAKNMSDKITKIFDSITKSKKVHEANIYIENTSGNFTYNRGYGGKDLNSPFVIASVTKLFTTACVLILKEQGLLSLSNKVSGYFDENVMKSLHVYKRKDYSDKLTISDLLFQVSGFPNALEEGRGKIIDDIIREDVSFTFEDIIARSKKLGPLFAPRSGRKCHYSDVNFELLGEICRKITGLALNEVYKKYIFTPLGLECTYLPVSANDFIPNFYYKDKSLARPKSVISCNASGGCVSNSYELMKFIKAFFGGKLFSADIFKELSVYRKVQFSMGPIYYGGGYMQIPMGGWLTLFMGSGELIGHSGSTGSFAFYYPLKDLYMVGDTNQLASPGLPIRLMLKIAMGIK